MPPRRLPGTADESPAALRPCRRRHAAMPAEPPAAVAAAVIRRRAVRPAVVLAVASMGLFMAFMDDTVVGIAFPNLVASFPRARLAELSWVLNSYNIAFAVLLVPAGRVADLVGRRRVFSAGLVVFTISSALCAAAPSIGMLIAVRALQGIGAALIVPSSLALVLEGSPPERRVHALSAWSATAALAAGIGPSIGGVLVRIQDWRLVFLVNLPIGVLTWYLCRRELVESRAPGRREMPDLEGAALLAAAIAAIALAIVQGPEWGWTSVTVVLLALAAVAAAVVLGRRSRQHPAPAIDRELVGMPGFRLTAVMTAIGSAGFFALGLANLLYLMIVWRYSPLTAGLAITPAPFAAALTAILAGRATARFQPRRLVLVGALIWTAGPLILLWRMGPRPDYLRAYLPAALVLAVGVGIVFPLVSDAVVSTAPRGRFAGASALNGTIRQLGATVGVAILAVLLGTATQTGAASPYRSGWIFATVCFGLVALGSVALRPFEAPVPEVDGDRAGSRSRVRRAASAPQPARSAAVASPPRAQSDEELLAEVPMFAALPGALLASLAGSCERVTLKGGEWLFRAGDRADAMYVVRSGRLEVLARGPDGVEEVLRELGPGSAVGELAVLSGGARSASIRSRRDAVLLRLGRGELETLLAETPGFAQALARVLGLQLQASRPADDAPKRPSQTVALLSLGYDSSTLQLKLVREIERIATPAWLDAARAREHAADDSDAELAQLLDRLESRHDIVLLLAGMLGADRWSEACVRQADRVIVFLDDRLLNARVGQLRGCDVVLLAPASSPAIASVLDELEPRSIHRLRSGAGRDQDLARLARRVARRSVGVVLSGGGARGFAHIGAVEELLAAGVQIDRVGGASMGAFVGALLAIGLDAASIDAVCYEEWVRRTPLRDYRLPRISLLKGAHAMAMLERCMPGLIEDLPLSYFCVSTDIIAAELVVHRRGTLALAVGASMALPGALPPVRSGQRLLLDGGVLDNLPVATMAAEDEGPIIACDVTEPEQRSVAPGEELPSPGLIDTLSRVMLLGTEDTLAQARRHADIVITPHHESVGRMEFHELDRMRESGRRAALEALERAPSSIWA
jgi:NTE family protein